MIRVPLPVQLVSSLTHLRADVDAVRATLSAEYVSLAANDPHGRRGVILETVLELAQVERAIGQVLEGQANATKGNVT